MLTLRSAILKTYHLYDPIPISIKSITPLYPYKLNKANPRSIRFPIAPPRIKLSAICSYLLSAFPFVEQGPE